MPTPRETPHMSQDNTEESATGTIDDPDAINKAAEEWAGESPGPRESHQDRVEKGADAVHDTAKGQQTYRFGGGQTFTDDFAALIEDQNKSDREILKEIRDALQSGGGTALRAPASATSGRESVSKSADAEEVALAEEDVEALLMEFVEEGNDITGPRGVSKFASWLRERIEDPRDEDPLLEKAAANYEALLSGVRKGVTTVKKERAEA